MSDFATVSDLIALWRQLSPGERERGLRMEAIKVGKNLDQMIEETPMLASVAKSVTVDVVARTLMTPTDETPMTQMTQSGLGYSVSGTYLVPGGGLFIKRSELARLGLRRQQIGVINLYDAQGNNGSAP